MSDSFSIAMVTSALYYLLSKKGITVSVKSPDLMADADKLVNLFLYQVTPNLGYRNMDLPARGSSGNMVTKQQLGLDLHYLITAYGEKDRDELAAHSLLGEVARLLHERPLLTRDFLLEIITEANKPTPHNLPENVIPNIKTSDLDEQLELVKLTIENLSLEDMTKLWSSFFKTGSYRISISYKATVVLIDGEHDAFVATPVRERNIYAIAPKPPQVAHVAPQVLEYGTAAMTILGKNLKADNVRIDFGEGKDIMDLLEPERVVDDQLEVNVSSLDIGVHQAQVVHPLYLGTPASLHRGLESNTTVFAIAPKFTHTPNPADAVIFNVDKLTIKVEQGIKQDQKVEVILGTQKPIQVVIRTEPVDGIEINVSHIHSGTYPVRLRVDGAETQPDKYFGEYMRPLAVITR
jgi:Pvc16 N-terminal domain